jgi:nucleoside-diphosphate-sugar epimerase
VWGDGTQVRNWTYIDDIVRGTLLAAEKIDDARAINLGTTERIRVIDAAKLVLRYTDHRAEIRLRPDMPTGPLNRAADNTAARTLLGWEPRTSFADGLRQTVDWYFATKDRQETARRLDDMLMQR